MTVEKVPIGEIIEHYGGRVIPRHGWQKIRCVLHDESNPSASVNLDEGLFKCFGCMPVSPIGDGRSSTLDGIDIVAIKEGCEDFASAVQSTADILGRSVADLLPESEGKSRRAVFGESRPKRGQRNAFSPRVRRKSFGGS